MFEKFNSINNNQGFSRQYDVDEVIARMVEMAQSGDSRCDRILSVMERADESGNDEIIERTGLGRAIYGLNTNEFSSIDGAVRFVMGCIHC